MAKKSEKVERKIIYIDDQDDNVTRSVKSKLESIIANNTKINIDTIFQAYIGKSDYGTVKSIQDGNIEIDENTLIFLDPNLEFFSENKTSPLDFISSIKIIETVKEKGAKVIMLSQYEKKADTSIGNWFDEYQKAGAFDYISKNELLDLNENQKPYKEFEGLILSALDNRSLLGYKIVLDYRNNSLHADLINSYSKQSYSIEDFSRVSIEDLVIEKISIKDHRTNYTKNADIARSILFKSFYNVASREKNTYPLISHYPSLFDDCKDSFERNKASSNPSRNLRNSINTKLRKELDLKDIELVSYEAGSGNGNLTFHVNNISITDSLKEQYEKVKNGFKKKVEEEILIKYKFNNLVKILNEYTKTLNVELDKISQKTGKDQNTYKNLKILKDLQKELEKLV